MVNRTRVLRHGNDRRSFGGYPRLSVNSPASIQTENKTGGPPWIWVMDIPGAAAQSKSKDVQCLVFALHRFS